MFSVFVSVPCVAARSVSPVERGSCTHWPNFNRLILTMTKFFVWPIIFLLYSPEMEHFEQLLTCCVCLDRYRNPKLLPCQHSFCMEPCMEGLVDYVRRQVKCPECRAEHRIPYQGVQAFPTNVTLQRFLELRMEITGEPPDPTSGEKREIWQ